MSLHRYLAALAAVVALASAGCGTEPHRGNANLQVTVRVSPAPPVVGSARVRVEVSDQRWNPRNGATVVLLGSRDGNGPPEVVDTARGEGGGRYVDSAFPFPGPGSWTITARAELPGGLWTEVDHALTVVPASAGTGGKGNDGG